MGKLGINLRMWRLNLLRSISEQSKFFDVLDPSVCRHSARCSSDRFSSACCSSACCREDSGDEKLGQSRSFHSLP
jgi:hypothetical protein